MRRALYPLFISEENPPQTVSVWLRRRAARVSMWGDRH